ncbi:MAG TPA: hypothetical protein VEG64_07235 [Candidatus Sulfotelmatobacter sp.]|nr:hypothetical protein [Candidatus Sulfotelmatobacter sp.]
MPGPLDYALWLVGFLAEIAVVVCAIHRRAFARYIPLLFYLLCDALVTLGLYYCLRNFGFNSSTYFYYYYYSESVLTILMFWVIITFYLQVFEEMGVSRQIRGAAVLLLTLTALFSYAVVHQNRDHLTSRFVVQLNQNLRFVGVVLTYLLWGAILKLRETRTRLVQLVLALGVYFSATAGTYALRNLFPVLQPSVLRWVPPVIGLWLPLAWGFTFVKVPEEARLATARLAVKAR